MRRTMTLLVLLVAVLGGCTGPTADPSPTPSPTVTTPRTSTTTPPPTGRVAVVVSPEPELMAAAAEVGSRSIATGLPDGMELRVVTADDASFVRDLTAFFATEGYDLVCVLGADADARRAPRGAGVARRPASAPPRPGPPTCPRTSCPSTCGSRSSGTWPVSPWRRTGPLARRA